VWVDNHILLDCPAQRASLGCLPRDKLPVNAGEPVALRVEFTHGTGSSPSLHLFWQGNTTTLAEVPATALSASVPSWENLRVELRDRLQNPQVPWQTWTQNMAAHVLMPQGLSIDATVRNLNTGQELGNIAPWRSFKPAMVRPGIHSLNGSDYTHFTLSNWGALDCIVNFSSTVAGNDLVWVIESSGTDCGSLAVVFHGIVKWGYSGSFTTNSPTNFTAILPGFDNVTVALVAGSPAQEAYTHTAPPPFTPFVVRLGGGAAVNPIVLATGATANTLNATTALSMIAAAAVRATYWLDSAAPGYRDAYEPLSAVLTWDTVFTPYLAPVTASSRLWVCTGGNTGCEQTGYTIFNWDMPMVAWTWAGLSQKSSFTKDMAYAQLIEDAYTRTLMGFVPNYSSGTYSSADRTQPPFFGFVAMQLYKQFGEPWLLEALFDPLLSYLNFLWDYRRGAGIFADSQGRAALFSWGSNNFSKADFRDAACTKAAAGYESGLDDSPMWDEAGWDPCNDGLGLMKLYDAGLTGLFLSESSALISIAGIIGRTEVVSELQARFNATSIALNAHLWNETRGFYNNVLWDGTPSVHLSPTSYYPLMAGPPSVGGAVPLERAAAMVKSLVSPLGMCLNTSEFGPVGPFAAPTSRWIKTLEGVWTDIATCVSETCMGDLVKKQYPLTPTDNLGAIVLNASAGGAFPSLVPLANWWSSIRNDTALTNDTSSPPYGDQSYVLQRVEGYCLPLPSHPAFPSTAPTTPFTTWRKGNDTAACSSPQCEIDMRQQSYTLLGTLCYAFSADNLGDYPCRFGAPSVSRDDPAFDKTADGYYWRGRIWPATEGSLYWALMPWGDTLVPGLGEARQALARQARLLSDFHWGAFGAVCENAHAILGTCAEMSGQGQAGDDDPLLNWSGIGPYLSIVEGLKSN